MSELLIYHGSQQIVAKPELGASRFFKDFARGFYCMLLKEQAIRWATRYPVTGYVSEYSFMKNPNLSSAVRSAKRDSVFAVLRRGKRRRYIGFATASLRIRNRRCCLC